MNPEELEREIQQLWSRVSSPIPEELEASTPPAWHSEGGSQAGTAAMEAISLIKRQHREQMSHWEEMLKLKDQALRELSEKLRGTEKQLIDLRRLYQQSDSRAMSEVSQVALQMESARQALKEQQERAAKEEQILREIADKTRQQMLAEAKRWRDLERQWGERESKYLDDVRELEQRIAKLLEQTGQHESKTRGLTDELKDAKKAIEATLGELLSERKAREQADKDREKALSRATELTDHLKQVETIWAEERKQWQELWDRERSTWESQKQQFNTWEEKIKQEREKWHTDLKQKEEQELKFATELTKTLRESTETTAKMKELIKTTVSAAKVAVAPAVSAWTPKSAIVRRVVVGLGAAAVALLIAIPTWKHLHRIRLTLASSHTLSLANPTAIAFDGNVLWAAEWSGRFVSLDPANPETVLSKYDVSGAGAYRPASLAIGGEYLWSLDTSQSRIVKHSLANPSKIQLIWPAPGPAPVALAHDGQHLWSYDAVNKSVYEHIGEGPGAQVNAYSVDADVVPAAMQWIGGELWMYDSKSRKIWRFEIVDKSLELIGSVDFDAQAISLASYRIAEAGKPRRMLWSLSSEPSGVFSLKKFIIQP